LFKYPLRFFPWLKGFCEFFKLLKFLSELELENCGILLLLSLLLLLLFIESMNDIFFFESKDLFLLCRLNVLFFILELEFKLELELELVILFVLKLDFGSGVLCLL
jgi:hypothetical protein